MAEHRTQMKIVGEILDTATQEIDEYEGTTITHIIRNANISHGRLSRILNNLVSQGLLAVSYTHLTLPTKRIV